MDFLKDVVSTTRMAENTRKDFDQMISPAICRLLSLRFTYLEARQSCRWNDFAARRNNLKTAK